MRCFNLALLLQVATSVEIFDFTAVANTYPTAAEFGAISGNGSGWGSGITQNFNGESSVVNPGDLSTSYGNTPQTTTYNGPTFYAGVTRDQHKGSAGVIHNNGNGFRIRVNNISQGDHDDNGGDVNFKAVFMFDALEADSKNYVFGESDTLVATVATPNNMKTRSSFASYRAMVKANGQYYAGSLNTIDLSALTGASYSTIYTMTEDAASATWTLMDNMESSNNQLQSVATHPQNLTVDGSTSVIGSELTNITQVGFLLETSSPVQTGGYNYGVRHFSADATVASPVCIAEGTLIETDVGQVKIEDLTPSHTTGGEHVRDITKQYVNTTADAQKMVQISKDALGPGVPNKDTLLTDYHMVYHPKYNDGRGVQASQMVDNDAIRYVAYTGHVYNVLFDKYKNMRGHNMTVGTLPPAHEKRWESSLVFGPKRRTRFVA
jgi:hypothetical protein